MQEIHLDTIQQFNDYNGMETLHPLVSVIHVDNTEHIKECMMHYGFYAIYLKENKGCKLSYGRTEYDFDEMTVTSFAPGQVVTVEPNPEVPFAKYIGLAFHPDLLNRTSLGKQMSRYEFFDYTSNEALHLSAQEVEIFKGVFSMIEQELHHAIDKHTRELVVSHIELLLNYCLRFYDRQFDTHQLHTSDLMIRLDSLLDGYLSGENQLPQHLGQPSVAWCAEQFHLSPNYFGDLVRKESSITAQAYIQMKIIEKAKSLLSNHSLSINEVASRLGFSYSNHFTRFFTGKVGITPSAFRTQKI